ncbi:MAG: sensor domain-containing diguanylate cyclase [Nitrospiraceae bacterium]
MELTRAVRWAAKWIHDAVAQGSLAIRRTNTLILVVTAALAGAVFVLDLVTPADVAVDMLYVVVVLVALWSPEPKYLLTVATACTLLILVGTGFNATALWPILSNQFIALFGVWSTALIGGKHKRMAEELRRKEKDLSDFLENAPVGIHWVGKDGRILWANREELNLVGYAKHEYLGHHLSEFYADPAALPDILERLNQGETLINYEARLRCKDGSIKQVMINSNVRWNHGTFVHTRSFTRDITERKQAEQALQQVTRKLTVRLSDLERHSRESVLLNEMGDLLQSCQTVTEAHVVIARCAQRLFKQGSGSLCLIGPDSLVESVAQWGDRSLGTPSFTTQECWALRRGHTHLVPELEAGLHCPHVGQALPGAYLCVPMMAQGEASGVLVIHRDRPVEGASQDEPILAEATQQLAVTVAKHAALALANLKLREALRQQSIHDGLTGLFNRRYMEETLRLELRRAVRSHSSVGVILIDLDHFKGFNDAFGHDAGDVVLRAVAGCLQKHIREHDIACRYGGEEFVLVLSDSTLDNTLERADELREEVRHLQVAYQGIPLGPVTVSMGVVASPNHGDTVEVILNGADCALYRAKAAGRDQYKVGPIPTGRQEPRQTAKHEPSSG